MQRFLLRGVGRASLGFFVASSLAAATPQQPAQARPLGDVPVQYAGTYRMADGTWTGGSRKGSRMLYNCTLPSNYYAWVGNSVTTAADQRWFDEGFLFDTNALAVDQVNGFEFAYCSTLPAPFGNSGAIQIAFFDDYVPCQSPAAATCAYLITGLPMGQSGYLQCWGVGIDLEGGFECTTDPASMFQTHDAGGAARRFGWSFGSHPSVSGMNDCGPLLARSCPNPVATGGCGTGNLNSYYWHDPAGIWTGCHWFGGVPWASFWMKMYGSSRNAYRFGQQGNTMFLRCSDFAPGSPVTFEVLANPYPGCYLVASPTTRVTSTTAGEALLGWPLYPGMPLVVPPTGVLTVTVPPALQGAYIQTVGTLGPATPAAVRALSNGLYCVR